MSKIAKKVATEVKRVPTDYIGHVGELKVAIKFLEMGCSVNSLTASDYGLDLHVQLPEQVILAKDQKKPWAMSGRAAHVQVKHSTDDNDHSIKIPTLRSWVTGSRTGIPTFLVCLFEEQARYATPWHFVEKLKEADSDATKKASKSFGKNSTLVLDEATFPYLLQLWTKYPGMMLLAKIDSWSEDSDSLGHFKALVAELCYAWAMDHRLLNDADITAVNRLMELARLAAPLVDKEADPWAFGEELLVLIEQGRNHIGKVYERRLTDFLAGYEDNLKKAKEISDADVQMRMLQELAVEKKWLGNAAENSPWPEPRYRHVYAHSTSMLGARDEALELIRELANYRTVLTEQTRADAEVLARESGQADKSETTGSGARG